MPEWKAEILRRLAGASVPEPRRSEILEELTQHLDDRYREHRSQGRSDAEATRAALAELQDADVLHRELRRTDDEPLRDDSRRPVLAGLFLEAREALRGLLRRPASTAVVVATLAVGMAATTTIWTIVDAVVLRPLPYADADRLVNVGVMFPGADRREDAPHLQRLAGTAVLDVVDWRARTRSFDALVPIELTSLLLPDGPYGPELANAARVGGGFFSALQAAPTLGRLFVEADFEGTGPEAMVLSHATWQSRYGGDPGVVGRTVGQMTVVGVLSPEFLAPEAIIFRRTDYWTPLRLDSGRYVDRGRRTAMVLGRLAPAVSVDDARAELAAVQAGLNDEYPEGHVYPDGREMSAGLNPLQAETVGSAARPLMIFLAAAGLLLGIACLNAMNLLLLGGIDRQGELALRRALGAGPARLLRAVLFESLWLALAAGAVGSGLAYGGVEAFLWFGGSNLPRLADVVVNGRVLAAVGLLSVGAGLAVGLVPAWRAARSASLSPAMQGSSARGVAAGGATFRSGLVALQLALATILAVGAGLLFSSFLKVTTRDVGFEPDRLTVFQVPSKGLPGPDSWRPWADVMDRVSELAGIDHVAVASDAPHRNPSWAPGIRLPGEAPEATRTGNFGFVVTPSYLDAVGGRLVEGRWLTDADGPDSVPVVVVNETFARRYLTDREPIGAQIVSGVGDEARPWTVVGVVADIVQRRVEDETSPSLYRSYRQEPWVFTPTILVRSARLDDGLGGELRAAATRVFPGLPVIGLQPMREVVSAAQVEPRFRALLFGAFAVVSLLLAAVGLYGSLAHTVGRRARELGIRLALGAAPGQVVGLVVRQGAIACAAGLAMGLAGAMLVGRFVEGFLFEMVPIDPTTYVAAGLTLVVTSIAAVWPPARRAARTDVTRSLRLE